MAYLTCNYDLSILSRVHGDDDGFIHPINIVSDNAYIFSAFTPNQKEKLTQGNGLMYFHHSYAILADTFNQNTKLKDFWTITATATTTSNETFAAALEAKNYPFYVFQFHP